ncbi:MAG: pseudouridine synthase, partial [bacterium]
MMMILFEDDDLIAVDKPVGVRVIPGRGAAAGPCLKELVAAHLGSPAFVVHRLDEDTSGAILFAKHAAAHRTLCMQFERHEVKKTYLARVLGKLEGEGVINRPIREFGSGRMGVDRRGKVARTRWRSLESGEASSLIEAEPL